MELYQLRTFVTVAEEKSISGAAKRLSTTPASVSMHIKSLETEFDVQLFVRTHQGVEITDKGKILEAQARQTLESAQAFAHHASELRDQIMGRVQIGLCASARYLRLADWLETCRRDYPAIEKIFIQSQSGSILRAIQAEKLDIGFVFAQVDDPLFYSHRLTMAELVIALPQAWSHRLESTTWENLAQLQWITAAEDCPFQPILDDLFTAQGLSYQKAAQTSDETTRFELVSAGVGASLLEKSEALLGVEQGLICIHDSAPIVCPLSLIMASHRQFEPLLQAVYRQIVQAWQIQPIADSSA